MGLRIRKSINLGGGFRINLSKSGIGYSWGVKGYRITKTAKGTTRRTVSIPGTGISYVFPAGKKRKTSHTTKASVSNKTTTTQSVYRDSSGQSLNNVSQIETANAETMRPAEYSDMFNAVKKLTTIAALLLALTIIFLFIAPIISVLLAVLFFVFIFTSNVQLDYEFDDYTKEKWSKEDNAWKELASCKKLWYVSMTASLKAKTNAGVDQGSLLSDAVIIKRLPWPLKSDLNPLIIKLKNQQYIFMPDRILVTNGVKLGAVSYQDINFKVGIQPYCGDIKVPSETEIMEYRWLKVNKNGTPDKRFKGNKQLPVYKLGAIYMTSSSGMNVKLLASKVDAVEKVNDIYCK